MKKHSIFAFLFLICTFAKAQDITKGTWYNDKKTAKIQFYDQNGKIFGKIVWLKEPNENGKPKLDKNNPDDKLKSKPIMGLVFLKNFEKDGDKAWEDGSIYDPESGKTYSCKMTLKNATTMDVRGYIGISLIGRSSQFIKAD
jgi:uncharacterized protein (DUF2147 family)